MQIITRTDRKFTIIYTSDVYKALVFGYNDEKHEAQPLQSERNPFMETSENILYRTYTAVRDNISKVVVGKQDIIDKLLVAVLCRGHVLLEDVPGTGKTLLIKSLAASLDCTAKRTLIHITDGLAD